MKIANKLLIILANVIGYSSVVFSQTIQLTWSPNQDSNISYYRIYRSSPDNSNFRILDTLIYNDSTFIDTNIESETRYFYTATAVDQHGNESEFSNIVEVTIPINTKRSSEFVLSQNYPNPFNPSTKIHFSLNKPQVVIAKVYDIRGQEVITLLNDRREAGSFSVVFNGKNFMNGVYFICINAGGIVKTRKMILLK